MAPLATAQSRPTAAQSTVVRLLRDLLLDRSYYWTFVALWLLGEAVLSGLIIRFIPYTNIDWTAYMQQVSMVRAGERDYSRIQGDTGYLVYPALHLYIYIALQLLLPGPKSCPPFLPTHLTLESAAKSPALDCYTSKEQIRAAQVVWAVLWVGTCGLVAWICWLAGSGRSERQGETGGVDARGRRGRLILGDNIPQVILPLFSLSKRLHSVYVLRMFNDPLAMLILYGAVVLLQKGRWTAGSIVYSLALGVKMNVLLFAPGLLVLLVQYTGIRRTIGNVGLIALIQILLPMPFFFSTPALAEAYFSSAFNFSRQFLFKWSVNWAWAGEERFLGSRFSGLLLLGHAATLLVFAWARWSRVVPGGTVEVLKRALSRPSAAPIAFGTGSPFHIAYTLFTSNLIGIFFARSLHYQFFSWYAHQVPFMLWCAWRSSGLSARQGAVHLVAFAALQYAWNAFPPSRLASAGLLLAHAWMIGGAWLSKERIGGGLYILQKRTA